MATNDTTAKYKIYDIEELNNISVKTVLEDYGINVKNNQFKLRDERTASCYLYEKNNYWIDFGSDVEGNALNLVMEIEGVDFKSATQILGDRYGIAAINNSRTDAEPIRKFLSVSDYNNLGMVASPASRNMLRPEHSNNFTAREVSLILDNYDMNMNDLYKKDPLKFHEILQEVAVPNIQESYKAYLQNLNTFNNSKNNYKKDSVEYKLAESFFYTNVEEYTKIFKSYVRAIVSTPLFDAANECKPNLEEDMKTIERRNIEIGDYPYSKLKQENQPLEHMKMTEEFYSLFTLKLAAHGDNLQMPFSAHIRGKTVNVSFLEKDSNAMKGIAATMQKVIQAEKKKEQEIFAQNAMQYDNDMHEEVPL